MKVWLETVARLVSATVEQTCMSSFRSVGYGSKHAIRFQKYRVAPRLGTDTVRRRLLRGLHEHAPLAATETGFA